MVSLKLSITSLVDLLLPTFQVFRNISSFSCEFIMRQHNCVKHASEINILLLHFADATYVLN